MLRSTQCDCILQAQNTPGGHLALWSCGARYEVELSSSNTHHTIPYIPYHTIHSLVVEHYKLWLSKAQTNKCCYWLAWLLPQLFPGYWPHGNSVQGLIFVVQYCSAQKNIGTIVGVAVSRCLGGRLATTLLVDHYFHHSSFHSFLRTTFSHRRSARIKKLFGKSWWEHPKTLG